MTDPAFKTWPEVEAWAESQIRAWRERADIEASIEAILRVAKAHEHLRPEMIDDE